MKRAALIGVAIISAISLSACGKVNEEEVSFLPQEAKETESANDYFFPQDTDSYAYRVSFAYTDFEPQQEDQKVILYITEVQAFEKGILYELKIDSDVEAPDTHAGYRGDWRNFGLFYVQGDEIYFIRADEAERDYQTEEEILNAGTLVCNEAGREDALGEDERGWHEFILVDGDRREYHGYSTLVETGYYEHFYWEKGKGLVTYESGYGAEADGIKMYLSENENLVAELESEETDAAADLKDITWEAIDFNVVNLHFLFEDGRVIDREIIAYDVLDIVYQDITGDGVDEVLIYCDWAQNICDWQLIYFYQISQGNIADISPSSEDIPELDDDDRWNMWGIAAETMEGYSSPIYELESYYKEDGVLYTKEILCIGYKDGKWELVQKKEYH